MTDTAPQPLVQEAATARPRAQNADRRKKTPASRPVHPTLQQLFELYPQLFGARFLPLKLGIFQELMAQHPEALKKDELKVALGLHARSTRYLESVASGLPRHDLNAEPVEPVAPEHVHHAIMEVFRRRQARSPHDLRPYAQAQLKSAIEASGLSREDYMQCIRQQDELSLALLDEVFSELAEQAAKRDALLKLFEASGKSEAEFADMYGMNPDEVSASLMQARAAKTAAAAAAAAAAAEAGQPPEEETLQDA